MGYNPPVVRKTWLKRFKKVHKKGEFKYNKSICGKSTERIRIFHVVCGKYYWQTPANHWKGCGCNLPSCRGKSISDAKTHTNDRVIVDFRKVHGKKYLYNDTYRCDSDKNYTITCTVDDHGDFKLRPDKHKQGRGCPKCKKT